MSARLRALDFIVDCLSVRSDLQTEQALRSAIVSSDIHWDQMLEIVTEQKIAPAFWTALEKRALAGLLPAEVRKLLFKAHLLNTLKNKALKEQAIEIISKFNGIGVEPLLLKGAVSLFVKTFDDPGTRVMADLDVLVPASSAQQCWNLLRAAGYEPIADNPHFLIDYAYHHHLRPLYRPCDRSMVEIHREGLPESTARILPTTLIWKHAEEVVNPFGIRMKAPSPSHRILHNILHSDVINRTYVRGGIVLRALHELAAIQTRETKAIDWATLERMMERGGQKKVFDASVYLMHRLLKVPMPANLRKTFRSRLHFEKTQLQLRWGGLHKLMVRASWFSAHDICERYRCRNDFWSVGKGRLRLAARLFRKPFAKRCLDA